MCRYYNALCVIAVCGVRFSQSILKSWRRKASEIILSSFTSCWTSSWTSAIHRRQTAKSCRSQYCVMSSHTSAGFGWCFCPSMLQTWFLTLCWLLYVLIDLQVGVIYYFNACVCSDTSHKRGISWTRALLVPQPRSPTLCPGGQRALSTGRTRFSWTSSSPSIFW